LDKIYGLDLSVKAVDKTRKLGENTANCAVYSSHARRVSHRGEKRWFHASLLNDRDRLSHARHCSRMEMEVCDDLHLLRKTSINPFQGVRLDFQLTTG
jgi:hypothetical protein